MRLPSWTNTAAVKMNVAIEIRNAMPEDGTAMRENPYRRIWRSRRSQPRRFDLRSAQGVHYLLALDGDRVAGHILFSAVTIADFPADLKTLGLAPVAVLPEFQRNGIGSKLIREGLERAKHAGYMSTNDVKTYL
jgi:putative acetyltransferase